MYFLFLMFLTVFTLEASAMQNYKVIDLTHKIHPEIPTWDLTCGYYIKTMRDYHHCEGEFASDIDLSSLANGIYYVKAIGYQSIKLIKND